MKAKQGFLLGTTALQLSSNRAFYVIKTFRSNTKFLLSEYCYLNIKLNNKAEWSCFWRNEEYWVRFVKIHLTAMGVGRGGRGSKAPPGFWKL